MLFKISLFDIIVPHETAEILPRAHCACFNSVVPWLPSLLDAFSQCPPSTQRPLAKNQWDAEHYCCLTDGPSIVGWCAGCCLDHEARYACVQIPAQSLFHHVPMVRLLNLSASQLQKSTKKKEIIKPPYMEVLPTEWNNGNKVKHNKNTINID